MLQGQLNTEFPHRRRAFKGGSGRAGRHTVMIPVVTIPLHHAAHVLHVLEFLLPSQEAVDAGRQLGGSVGHIAAIAEQAVLLPHKQGIGVLRDAEGLQGRCLKDQRTLQA